MPVFRSIAVLSLLAFLPVATTWAHVPHDIIYSLDVSPTFSEDGQVFASSTQFGEGHLTSSNYGETFSESHAGMQRTLVTGHTFSPSYAADETIFMTTKNGYYKSTDRGRNWQKQPLFADEEVLSICTGEDYAETQSIYVLTKKALFKVGDAQSESADKPMRKFDESTFGKLQIAGGRLFVHRVFYDTPKKKNGMELVSYATGTVEVLDNATDQWSTLATAFDSRVISDFDVSADGENAIVALKDGSVHRSNDACESWTQVFQRKDDFICKLKLSPDYANDGTIVCGTAKGFVFLSENDGADWEVRSNGLSRWVHHVNILINRIVFSPNYKNDKTVLLGKTTGLYKTTDKGKFWRHINVWNPKWGYFVYPAPGKDSKDVFTATYNSGISRSHDLGETWSSANIGITSAFANGMALSPNYEKDKTIFVLDIATGLYRSADAGRSWSKVEEVDTAKVIGKPVLYRKLGVSSEFAEDGLIYLFSVPRKVLGVPEKHVWRFNDKTKELKQLSIGGNKNYVNGFAFSPKGSKQKVVFASTAQGIFRSEDSGDTWTQVSHLGSKKLFVSPDFGSDGLVYSMDNKGRLHASQNRGQAFKPTKLGLEGKYVDNLTFSPRYADDRTLFATTFGEGVFRSRDTGKTWESFGLKGKWLFSGPTFSSNYAADRTLFAPAVDGIYRSFDGGETWNNVLRTTQRLPKVPLLTLKDPAGKEVPLTFGVPAEMKRYGMYDEEVGRRVFPKSNGAVQKIHHPKAYLASYYRFNVVPGSAVEVYFYGTGIEYKCVQGNDLGIVNVELDGEEQGEFDLYNRQQAFDVTGFRRDDLKKGFHTLRVIATGRKNKESTGKAMTFNAANITN